MRTILMSIAVCLFAATAEAGTALPVHGNWCGPNHGGGAVLDPLDAACRRHDICFESTRNFDCGCDLHFMDELRRRPWPSQALYLKARAVYEAIALVPCFGTTEQQATKLDWVRHDTAGAVARGREAPGAAFERVMRLIGIGLANAYDVEE
jgi:hypothetical protein